MYEFLRCLKISFILFSYIIFTGIFIVVNNSILYLINLYYVEYFFLVQVADRLCNHMHTEKAYMKATENNQ